MSDQSGRLILASGNIFRWEVTRVAGRGALRGDFVSTPSGADMAEAGRFVKTQAPAGVVGVMGVIGETRAKQLVSQHLHGGSKN